MNSFDKAASSLIVFPIIHKQRKFHCPPAQNAHHSDIEKGNPFCYCTTNWNLNA